MGGSQVSFFLGGRGVPGLRFWGGPRSQIFWGGPRSQIFWGGPRSQIFGGGYPVSVKGKFFDTRFGLIHVQTGKRDDPPSTIARNCYGYAAGGMPLAFTQEDFLVYCQYFQLSTILGQSDVSDNMCFDHF